jgi:hypothetical protein
VADHIHGLDCPSFKCRAFGCRKQAMHENVVLGRVIWLYVEVDTVLLKQTLNI